MALRIDRSAAAVSIRQSQNLQLLDHVEYEDRYGRLRRKQDKNWRKRTVLLYQKIEQEQAKQEYLAATNFLSFLG